MHHRPMLMLVGSIAVLAGCRSADDRVVREPLKPAIVAYEPSYMVVVNRPAPKYQFTGHSVEVSQGLQPVFVVPGAMVRDNGHGSELSQSDERMLTYLKDLEAKVDAALEREAATTRPVAAAATPVSTSQQPPAAPAQAEPEAPKPAEDTAATTPPAPPEQAFDPEAARRESAIAAGVDPAATASESPLAPVVEQPDEPETTKPVPPAPAVDAQPATPAVGAETPPWLRDRGTAGGRR